MSAFLRINDIPPLLGIVSSRGAESSSSTVQPPLTVLTLMEIRDVNDGENDDEDAATTPRSVSGLAFLVGGFGVIADGAVVQQHGGALCSPLLLVALCSPLLLAARAYVSDTFSTIKTCFPRYSNCLIRLP